MLLIGSLRLDALGGFIDGEPAEFVGFRPEDGDSGRGVSCEAVRVGCTYPMIGAAGWLGSVLIDQQCQAFPLVPLLRRLSFSAYCFDSAVGVGHAGVALGSSCRCLCRPPGQRLVGAGRLATPSVVYLRSSCLGLLGHGLIFVPGLASAEPSDHATAQAIEAVRGLTADGPVKRVTDELSRLGREAERAELAAERWEQIANRLDAQRATHRAEDDESVAALRKAEEAAEQIRAEVAQPLIVQAEHDGAAYLAAVEDETAASARLSTVGRFGRRKALTKHRSATEQTQTLRAQMRESWCEPPRTAEALPAWAEQRTKRHAEHDPRVIDAAQHVEAARAERETMRKRHEQEHLALLVSEYGAERVRLDHLGMRMTNPRRDARDARAKAAMTGAEADELRSLPIPEAAARIEAKRAEQEQRKQQAAERARQLTDPFEHDPHRNAPRHEGPTRGL